MAQSIESANVVRYLEVKAYLDDYKTMCKKVATLAERGPLSRVQDDTFFKCNSGRLKLRFSGQMNELIFYKRETDYGPKESFYQKAQTSNPGALRSSLKQAFGEAGRVRKFRRTFRIGDCTVNVDRVGGLGDFIELKMPLKNDESGDEKLLDLENLMQVLNIDLFQLVDGAYVDLINERQQSEACT